MKSRKCHHCERSYIPTGRGQKYCKQCKIIGRLDHCRNAHYERKFNVTLKQYQDTFEAQNGCCAICGKHQSELKQKLSLDHCHETDTIRGLLCYKCNPDLGIYELRRKEFEIYLQSVPRRMLNLYRKWLND